MRRRPECSHGDEGEKRGFGQKIIYRPRALLARGGGDCKSRAAAAGGRGGRAGSVARRPRVGTTAPERENTMISGKSAAQSRGQAKGFFFHKQGGAFDSTFYVQSFGARCLYQHELARRVALEYFSTSACRTRSTGRARSTGPVDHPRGARGPAGQLSGRDPTNPWSGGADRGPTSRASTGRRRAYSQTRPWTALSAGGRAASMN